MKYLIVLLMIFSVHAEAKRRRHRDRERPAAPSFPADQMKSLKKDGAEYSLKTSKTNCNGSTDKFCVLKLQVTSKVGSEEKNKWETDLYIKDLNPEIALEKQEIKVEKFAFGKGETLSIIDERGVSYVVDMGTGELQKPARAIVYPAAGGYTQPAAPATAAASSPAPAASPASSPIAPTVPAATTAASPAPEKN